MCIPFSLLWISLYMQLKFIPAIAQKQMCLLQVHKKNCAILSWCERTVQPRQWDPDNLIRLLTLVAKWLFGAKIHTSFSLDKASLNIKALINISSHAKLQTCLDLLNRAQLIYAHSTVPSSNNILQQTRRVSHKTKNTKGQNTLKRPQADFETTS